MLYLDRDGLARDLLAQLGHALHQLARLLQAGFPICLVSGRALEQAHSHPIRVDTLAPLAKRYQIGRAKRKKPNNEPSPPSQDPASTRGSDRRPRARGAQWPSPRTRCGADCGIASVPPSPWCSSQSPSAAASAPVPAVPRQTGKTRLRNHTLRVNKSTA